jgi:ribosomal protein L7/L12
MNYTIKSKLGEGGMATVYLAEDHKFHTEVALKMLKKEFVTNENIKKRFLAEARSMFRMSHPHVIRVSDLIDEEDTVAFVMEYVEGETLKEYLDRKGKLTDAEIKDIFSQMLDAVGYVHEQKLVHRDIKPSNFMLDKSGRVKLMDFGIAKNTDVDAAEYTQTGTGMQMGTPMYMSPEQITETKSVTAQSDVFSLGVVLWQLVTGQKPYDTKTLSNFQLQTKIVTENLATTHTFWDGIIQQATAKDVDTRYRSCVELKLDLTSPKEFKVELEEFTQIDGLKTQVELNENPSFDVILKSAGNQKLAVVKLLMDLTGLGLKEAKDLVDATPKSIKESISQGEAENIKKIIEEQGGKVEITKVFSFQNVESTKIEDKKTKVVLDGDHFEDNKVHSESIPNASIGEGLKIESSNNNSSGNYYFKVLKNYATFRGRARRSEYWYFVLFNLIISFGFGFVCGLMQVPQLANLYSLAVLIPSIAVGVRRMHDIGKSGWFYLIPIYNLILACTEGTKGENKFGSDPKATS